MPGALGGASGRRELRATVLERLPLVIRRALHHSRSRIDPRLRAEQRLALETADAVFRALSPLQETVAAGPFTGMKFPPRLVRWGRPAPYLIGSYEAEVQDHLERLLAKSPQLVINVGAAEGYYAVGIARRLERARVVAVDPDEDARARCRQLAELNGVESRVQHRPAITASDLRGLLEEDALIICDCEGCEVSLLDTGIASELRAVDLLVELHDHVIRDAARTIVDRFSDTHRVIVARSCERLPDPQAYPALRLLPEDLWHQLLDETRPGPMQWAVVERVH